jgi:hypothetical protein
MIESEMCVRAQAQQEMASHGVALRTTTLQQQNNKKQHDMTLNGDALRIRRNTK